MSRLRLRSCPQVALYARAFDLMQRYRKIPMDFVDSLLVAAADQLSIKEVLTLDRRGFEMYRSS